MEVGWRHLSSSSRFGEGLGGFAPALAVLCKTSCPHHTDTRKPHLGVFFAQPDLSLTPHPSHQNSQALASLCFPRPTHYQRPTHSQPGRTDGSPYDDSRPKTKRTTSKPQSMTRQRGREDDDHEHPVQPPPALSFLSLPDLVRKHKTWDTKKKTYQRQNIQA